MEGEKMKKSLISTLSTIASVLAILAGAQSHGQITSQATSLTTIGSSLTDTTAGSVCYRITRNIARCRVIYQARQDAGSFLVNPTTPTPQLIEAMEILQPDFPDASATELAVKVLEYSGSQAF